MLTWFGRIFWRLAVRTTRFVDDWEGEEAHHGHPAQPGVMARLETLESGITGILGQVTLNSGHSLRDEVQSIDRRVRQLQQDVTTLAQTVDKLRTFHHE